MKDGRRYSTVEVCEMFRVSRSTLFRWEREGMLGEVERGIDDDRKYSSENLKLLRNKKFSKQYKSQIVQSDKSKYNINHYKQNITNITQDMSVSKVLIGDITGLVELEDQQEPLKPKHAQHLLRFATNELEPKDEQFCRIIHLIATRFCSNDQGSK